MGGTMCTQSCHPLICRSITSSPGMLSHRPTYIRVKASQAFLSGIVPLLEWCPSHFSMDTGFAVKILGVIWDIVKANNQFSPDHCLKCILPRVGESFVCKVK